MNVNFNIVNTFHSLVCTNKDLLKLGLCTHKTLQKGHEGYKSLKRLLKIIDERGSKVY